MASTAPSRPSPRARYGKMDPGFRRSRVVAQVPRTISTRDLQTPLSASPPSPSSKPKSVVTMEAGFRRPRVLTGTPPTISDADVDAALAAGRRMPRGKPLSRDAILRRRRSDDLSLGSGPGGSSSTRRVSEGYLPEGMLSQQANDIPRSVSASGLEPAFGDSRRACSNRLNKEQMLSRHAQKRLSRSCHALRRRFKESQDDASTISTMSEDYPTANSEVTIVDFVAATGEPKESLKKNMNKIANRRMLATSAKWTKVVEETRRAQEVSIDDEDDLDFDDDTDTSRSLNRDIGIFAASLSPECAKLEVEAISLMSSAVSQDDDDTEIGGAKGCALRSRRADDDMQHELLSLNDSVRSLRSELTFTDVLAETGMTLTMEEDSEEEVFEEAQEELLESLHFLGTSRKSSCVGPRVEDSS